MDAIAVINAGSSSLKFSLFAATGGDLDLVARGQAEGLYTAPAFVAKDANGQLLSERTWSEGTKLGHDGALDHLVPFLQERFADHQLVAVGHRVVHGGSRVRRAHPCRRGGARGAREVRSRSRRCISRTTSRRSGRCSPARRTCRRSRASIPRSTVASLRSRRRSRCRSRSPSAACAAMASTASPTSTSRRRCPTWIRAPRRARRSCCTSATVRACVRWRTERASRARWASPRPTGCRWERAAAASTRAWSST